jgi:hypothetical protein
VAIYGRPVGRYLGSPHSDFARFQRSPELGLEDEVRSLDTYEFLSPEYRELVIFVPRRRRLSPHFLLFSCELMQTRQSSLMSSGQADHSDQ